MRRELGRQLAARRRMVGYVQRELGSLMGYSRTAIANAETGSATIGRRLWERADQVLGTGELFARGYARMQAQIAAESRADTRQADSRQEEAAADDLESLTAAQAREAYLEHGWPVVEQDERLWLMTGTVVDVLEVPRQAGMLAMGWWLYTRGVPDEIRRLPALPDPASALALIIAGPRCYFLTRSGMCPWTRSDIGAADAPDSASSSAVRWHADGGRVPAPPSPLDDGEPARWAHVPSGEAQLASPMALLHVLAQATATSRDGTGLILPGGVRAVPAGIRAQLTPERRGPP